MTRIQRQRRVDCLLKCEIQVSARRRVRGRVVTLSEGGLAVVADHDVEQGDAIQLVIDEGPKHPAIPVSAIVWNNSPARPWGQTSGLRNLGCIVSEPPREYLALFESLDPKSRERRAVPVPLARPIAVDPEIVEQDLPRSREIQPPLKEEPEEDFPYFRLRMKQIGGPRTRVMTLRARSATHAEQLALEELQLISSDTVWSVLEIAGMLER